MGGRMINVRPTRTQSFIDPPPVQVEPVPGVIGAIQRILPGGKTGFQVSLPGAVGPGGIAGLLGARGGVTGAAIDPVTGQLVRTRRRRRFNTSNGRANARAVSRLKASEKQSKAMLKAVGYRTISKQSTREIKMSKKVAHHHHPQN